MTTFPNQFTPMFVADREVQERAAADLADAQAALLANARAAGAHAKLFSTGEPDEAAVLTIDRAVMGVALVMGEIARRYPEHFVKAAAFGHGQFRALFDSLEDTVRSTALVAANSRNAVIADNLDEAAAASEWERRAAVYAEEHVKHLSARAAGEERDADAEVRAAIGG